MSDNDFKLVTYKRKSRTSLGKPKRREQFLESNLDIQTSKKAALRRIHFAREEIATSDFYSSVLVVLQQGLNLLENAVVKEIVCYGLGKFSECVSARFQLALLLLLKDHFSARVYVYDPVFSEVECHCLNILDCELITENEEGKRRISTEVTTLVYLPHCPKEIVNNFLWANWGDRLKNCVLVGNSFSQLVASQPDRILQNSANYILNIHAYTEEFDLVNSFKYTDIFNDLSIHVFPLKNINCPEKLWVLQEEPQYCEEETEFMINNFVC